jgi:hypothetical protein
MSEMVTIEKSVVLKLVGLVSLSTYPEEFAKEIEDIRDKVIKAVLTEPK